MKKVSAEELTEAYKALYPEEFKGENAYDHVKRILSNWLAGYLSEPKKKITSSNWSGKVTKALFLALGIKVPKKKSEMLKMLEI